MFLWIEVMDAVCAFTTDGAPLLRGKARWAGQPRQCGARGRSGCGARCRRSGCPSGEDGDNILPGHARKPEEGPPGEDRRTTWRALPRAILAPGASLLHQAVVPFSGYTALSPPLGSAFRKASFPFRRVAPLAGAGILPSGG